MNYPAQLGNTNKSSQPTKAGDLAQPSCATSQHLDDAFRSATFKDSFWCGNNVRTSPLGPYFPSGQFAGTDFEYKPGIDNGSKETFGDCNLAVKALTNVAVDTLEGNSAIMVAALRVPEGLDPVAPVPPPRIQSTLNADVLSASSQYQHKAQFNSDSNPGSPLFSPSSTAVDLPDLPEVKKVYPARVFPPEHKGKERQKDGSSQKWTVQKAQPQKSLPKTSVAVNHPATSSTSLVQGKVNNASKKGSSKALATPVSKESPVFALDIDVLTNPPDTNVQQQPLPFSGTTCTPMNNANVTSISTASHPRVNNSAPVNTSFRVNENVGQKRARSSSHIISPPVTAAHDPQPTHTIQPSPAAQNTLPVRNDQPSGSKKRKRAESSSANPSANLKSSEPSASFLPTEAAQVPIENKPKLKRRRTAPNVNAQSTSSLGVNVVPSGPPPGQAMVPAMAAAGPLTTPQGDGGQNPERSGVPVGAVPPLNRTLSAGSYLGDQAFGYPGQFTATPAMSSGQVLPGKVDATNGPQAESIDGGLIANPTIPNSAHLKHNVFTNSQMPQAFNNPNVNSRMSMPAFLNHPSNSRGISVTPPAYPTMSPKQVLMMKYQYLMEKYHYHTEKCKYHTEQCKHHTEQAEAIERAFASTNMTQGPPTAVPAPTPPPIPNLSSNQPNQNPSLTNSHLQGSHSRPQTPIGNHFVGGNGNMPASMHPTNSHLQGSHSRPQTPTGNHFAGGNGNMQVSVHPQPQRNNSYNSLAGPSRSLQRNMVDHIAPPSYPTQPVSSNVTVPGRISGQNVPFARGNPVPPNAYHELGVREQPSIAISSVGRKLYSADQSSDLARRG